MRAPQDAPPPERITRRGLMLLGLQLGVIGGLGWRMRHLQVEEHSKYRLMAEENRINMRLIPPARGLLFDRDGVPLAVNRQNYRIVMVREQAGDPEAVLARLAEVIPLPPEDRERALREVMSRSAFVPVVVTEHLSWDDVVRVAANAPVLPGVAPEVGLSRFYPHAQATGHVVGYVGPVSDSDLAKLENPDPVLQIPRFQIGKTGVEQRMEDVLRGEAGNMSIEVSAAGRVMRELGRVEGVEGRDVRLTIDNALQSYAMKRMAGESAAAVVLDVANGDVMALASSPGFDPNSFVFGISSTEWNALMGDEYRPLANKTVSGVYPPGSTFKMVVALAALEAGVMNPGDTVFCGGSTQLGRRRFHCWKRGGHGTVALQKSLSQSCDVYYYEMARRVGADAISAMANRLGLGVRPDLPLQAVTEGLMPRRRVETGQPGHALDDGRHVQLRDRPGPDARLAGAARDHDGAAGDGAGRDGAAGEIRRRRRGADARLVRSGAVGAEPERGARRDVRGLERRHGVPVAHRRSREPDGGQDRHEPGADHHGGRARGGCHAQRAAALEPARPRALRLLRAI